MLDDWSTGAKVGLAVGVVAILVIGFVVFSPTSGSVNAVQVEPIQDADTDGDGADDSVKLGFHVQTTMSDYSGDGSLKVLYDEGTVMTKTLTSHSGAGELYIPYSDFVEGNGDYTFRVKFGDVEKSAVHNVNWVVEKVSAYVQMGDKPTKDNRQVELDVSIRLTDSSGLGLSSNPQSVDLAVTVTNPSNEVVYSTPEDDVHLTNLRTTQFTYTVEIAWDDWVKGDYEIKAELTNTMCKQESQYHHLEGTITQSFDSYPIAVLTADKTTVTVLDNTVTFDATQCVDDSNIISYTWRVFNTATDSEVGNSTESAGNAEDGTFDGKWTFSISGSTGTYRVELSVLDDSPDIHVSVDTMLITKQAL